MDDKELYHGANRCYLPGVLYHFVFAGCGANKEL